MRRSKTDIIFDILRHTEEWKNKTAIIYGCNLNFTIIRTYLAELLDHELLVKHEKKNVYRTTKKGHVFIRSYLPWRHTIGGDVAE